MGLWTLLFECMSVVSLIYILMSLLWNKEYRTISELVAGILFGFILEYANVYIFKTYTYNTQFYLQLGQIPNNIPLSIAFSWGIIIISTHRIIRRYNLSIPAEICAEALLGLTLDAVMDIIAVRLDGGFWNWLTIPLTSDLTWESIYGIPWGNYYGWFCVLLISSTIFHIERKKISSEKKWLLLLLVLINPIVSTLLLLGFLFLLITIVVSGVYTAFPPITVLIFGSFLAVAIIITIANRIRKKSEITPSNLIQPLIFFISSHLFFIIAAIVEGIFVEMWGLIIAEVVLLGSALIVDIKSLKGPKFTLL